jgi:hypothetical protein
MWEGIRYRGKKSDVSEEKMSFWTWKSWNLTSNALRNDEIWAISA